MLISFLVFFSVYLSVIFVLLLLPALKMTLDGWKLVSNKHLQSKSLHSLVLCNNEHTDQVDIYIQWMDPERISRGLVLLEQSCHMLS